MAATTVQVQMQQRRDTAAGWTSANPTLLSGEFGVETDTNKVKIGDGSTAWNALAYIPGFSISNYPIATADIDNDAVTSDKLANNIDIAGTLDVTSAATFDDDVTIQGDLTVNGTTTTIDTTTLVVEDKNIEMGVVTTPSDATADGGGITLKGTTDKTINWIDATDAWTFSEHVNIASGKEYRIAGTSVLTADTLGSGVTNSSLTSVGTITSGVWNGTALLTAAIGDLQITTGKLAENAVTSAKIAAGTIVDGDINASAAIAGTKIDPDFGSQTVETAGVFSADGGAETTPSITFTGDLDTGIYSPGADQLALASNGVQRANFGTSEVVFNDGGEDIDFRIEGDTESNLFFVDAGNDSVSIGGDITITDQIIHSGDSDTAIRFPAADTFAIETAGSERARVDSSGRLLVGTSTAYQSPVGTTPPLFQVHGTNAVGSQLMVGSWSTGTDTAPSLSLCRADSGAVGTYSPTIGSSDVLGNVRFNGSDGTKFIEGAKITASADGTWGNDDGPTKLVFSTTADGASSPTERMRIDNNGQIQMGRTAPVGNERLALQGIGVPCGYFFQTANSNVDVLELRNGFNQGAQTATYIRFADFGGTTRGSITGTTSGMAYNTTSDYRLKENITLLTGAINRVNQLKVHCFNFIDNPGRTVDGFIAHEAQTVVPECVTGTKDEVDDEGNPVYQGIDQSKLVPLLTAALQEAIAKIETLEAKVAALEVS